MNIEKTLNKAIVFLKQHNIKNPHLDSEILLSKIINKDRKYVILNSKENLKDKDLNNFNVLIDRRRKGEPIAYLVNNKEFWKYTFYVDQNVKFYQREVYSVIDLLGDIGGIIGIIQSFFGILIFPISKFSFYNSAL